VLSDFTADRHDRAASIMMVGPLWGWKTLLGVNVDLFTRSAVALPLVVALWALPMIPLLRGNGVTLITWVRPAVWGGAAGGAAVLAAWLGFRTNVHATVPLIQRTTPGFADAVWFWQVAVAVSAQVIVAVIVTLRTDGRPLAAGLAASMITGVLAALVFELTPSLGACVHVLSLGPSPVCGIRFSGYELFDTARSLVVEGALFSMAIGGIAVAATNGLVQLLRSQRE